MKMKMKMKARPSEWRFDAETTILEDLDSFPQTFGISCVAGTFFKI